MNNKPLYFLVSKQPMDKTFIKYAHVSLNSASLNPYTESMLESTPDTGFNIAFGDLFEIKDGYIKTAPYPYQTHNYDLVVILGKAQSSLLIYSSKIGKQIIEQNLLDNNLKFAERGDKLLIEICNKGSKKQFYRIIHNVSHAIKQYEADQQARQL